MKRRQFWINVFVAVALLVFPREGRAGIGEIILEMSGPTMLGLLGQCKFDLRDHTKLDRCKVFPGISLAGNGDEDLDFWLAIEGGLYVSTGFGKNTDLYSAGEVFMLAVDPIVEKRVWGDKNLGIHIGAGASYNFIIDTQVNNLGFKLRPFALSFPFVNNMTWDVEFNLRLYPKEFTPEDFGEVGAPPGNSIEVVKGISAILRF